MKTSDSHRKKHVGIWWVCNGEVLKYSQDVNAIQSIDGWKDVDVSHFDYWQKMSHKYDGLSGADYTAFPRGRILFNEQSKTFTVYGDKKFLQANDNKNLVLNAFGLLGSRVNVVHDRHYEQACGLLDEGWDKL